MQSLGNFPDRFLAEIAGQPEALNRAAQAAAAQADQLEQVARIAGSCRQIVFTGMGSSHFACYAPVTTLAQAGVASAMIDAAELLHFRMHSLTADTLLICVSQSGESAEPVRVLETLAARPNRPHVVTITNGTQNSLARMADTALDTAAGEELGPSTMTFAGSLVLLRALAAALGGDDADPGGAERAAESVARLTATAETSAAEIGRWLGDRPSLVIVSRGHGRPAAEMGALTLKEAARFGAESLQTAQFRHGPLELASAALAAMVIAVEPATLAYDLELAAELVAAGAAVMVVSAAGEGPAGALTVATGTLSPGLISAAAIVPAQLLAWRMAVDRGYDPGTYAVANKVTTRE